MVIRVDSFSLIHLYFFIVCHSIGRQTIEVSRALLMTLLYLEKNIGHPDTSFCMQTDRYPDTIHKKSQTPSSILNAYSVDLNLAHILKKDVYPHRCTSKLCLGRLTPWLSLLVVSAYCSYCVCFASLALWLIPVAPKANQSKTSIQRLE